MTPTQQLQLTFARPIAAQETQLGVLAHAAAQQAVTGPRFASALSGLADVGTDVGNFFSNILGTITGAKGQAESQERALELARINAQRDVAEAQASAQLWGASLPYVVVGAVGLVGLVVWATRR